jgi:PAS domain S-box-containing protein
LAYGLVGLVCLAFGLIRFPPTIELLPELALVAGLIGFAAAFPFPLGRVPTSLAFIPAVILAYGPGASGLPWALLLGTAFGTALDVAIHPTDEGRASAFAWGWTRSTLTQTVPTLVLALLAQWLTPVRGELTRAAFVPHIIAWLLFGGTFVFSHWLLFPEGTQRALRSREWAGLAALAFIPLPYAVLAGAAVAQYGLPALGIFGGVPAGLSPIIRDLILTQRDLERRLAELTSVGRISQLLQTSLDKETVLNAIFLQVSTLMDVDNLYVAMLDERRQSLTYLLAVRNGLRQAWPDRPLGDRLTDRVICTREPILIPRDGGEALRALDLPDVDNPPEAWLGVPLVTPSATLGCLAVFHMEVGRSLSSSDLEILQTLAGQASAALENAGLFEQAQARAESLATLSRVTTALRSTLDFDHTLELIVRALADVAGSSRIAVFLHDAPRRQLYLARASGLSDSFLAGSIVIDDDDRLRARGFSQQAVLSIDLLHEDEATQDQLELMRSEQIQSMVQLPLATPEGPQGQVSIYFDALHRLAADEVSVLETIAGHAGLAVAMSRQHTETDQALRRRLAQISALEAIGRDLNSTLSLGELLERVLGHALRYTGAALGQIALRDERTREYRTECKAEPIPGTGRLKLAQPDQHRASTLHWLARGSEPMILAERSEMPGLEPLLSARTESVLAAPVHRQGQRLGVILLESPLPAAFNQEQSRFLAQLAAEAAIALANVRLYEQLEARLREQSLLFQTSAGLAQALDSRSIGYAVVESLGSALEADRVRLYLVEDENSRLVLHAEAIAGRASRLPAEAERLAPGHVAACVQEGRLIQLEAGASAPAAGPHAEPGALPVLAVVPVQAGDQGLGAIELAWQRAFALDDSRIRMAMTIASQAATALQAAELFSRISQSNNRLLAVLNSAHEGMLMMDVSGRVLVVNPQFQVLTGLPTSEMIGRSLPDAPLPLAASLGYTDAELQQRLADLRQGVAIPGGSREFESPLDRQHALERTEAAVRDAQGVLIGWLVVLRDISQQKALDHAREQLTEMIVHDLRSPLTAVLGSLKLLQASLRPDERTALTEQALTVSQRSCQQMMEMVSSLLDLAKLESGEFQLRWEQVSLDALCQDLIALHIPEANALGIILELEVQAGLATIRADGGMVRRCLSNLLDNALKFTPQGGHVTLRVDQQGARQIISVEDTGPGVPLEYRERIFERFGQIPGAAGRRRGTGLGLPFARLATEAHGGSIRVAEGAEGGARFEIRLPTGADSSD